MYRVTGEKETSTKVNEMWNNKGKTQQQKNAHTSSHVYDHSVESEVKRRKKQRVREGDRIREIGQRIEYSEETMLYVQKRLKRKRMQIQARKTVHDEGEMICYWCGVFLNINQSFMVKL